MRIGVDYRPALGAPTGIGRFVREIVTSLSALPDGPDLVLYAALFRRFRERTDELPEPSTRIEPCVRRFPGRLLDIASRYLPVSAESFTGDVDLFHITDYTHPPVRSDRVLFTIHDLSFEAGPEWYTQRMLDHLKRRVAHMLERPGASILTVSESSRRDICEHSGLPEDRVHVASLGVDPHEFRHRGEDRVNETLARLGIETPYFLFVGTIQPRKNLDGVIRALEIARSRGIRERLVVSGSPGWHCDGTLDELRRLEEGGAAHRLGYAADADLPDLYAGATALVFPSHHEGFGLPVVEAMSVGTPVLTSTTPALREVGGDAVLAVESRDDEALAEAMIELAQDGDLQAELSRRGRARAERFRWEGTAKAVLDAYRRSVA